MKVIILGATGMVGQSALREALAADEVEAVAMLRVTQGRADHFILESRDINRVGV